LGRQRGALGTEVKKGALDADDKRRTLVVEAGGKEALLGPSSEDRAARLWLTESLALGAEAADHKSWAQFVSEPRAELNVASATTKKAALFALIQKASAFALYYNSKTEAMRF
jgi:hypothetical protein